jgi:hypothetical protein
MRIRQFNGYCSDNIDRGPRVTRRRGRARALSCALCAVASYTPGLQYNTDGSLSVYMARRPPKGVPAANWLPVSFRKFNVARRVYGPEGDVEDNTYIPPGIRKRLVLGIPARSRPPLPSP